MAGVNARSVADVKLFNDIFTDCDKSYRSVELGKLRLGYPTNFWADLGLEVTHAATSKHHRADYTNIVQCFAVHVRHQGFHLRWYAFHRRRQHLRLLWKHSEEQMLS